MTSEKSDGFTLLEMLGVLMIAALALAIMASSPFGVHRNATAASTARRIAVELAALDAISVATARPQSVIVDIADHAIIVGTKRIEIPADLNLTLATGAELITRDQKGQILFYPDGTSSGGEIILRASKGKAFSVQVNWITGSVQTSGPLK